MNINKIITTVAVSILMSSPVIAEEKQTGAEYCLSVEKVARKIMGFRQEGRSLKKVMAASDVKLIQLMARKAYSQPKFNGEKYQQQTINKFADAAYLKCLNIHDKG